VAVEAAGKKEADMEKQVVRLKVNFEVSAERLQEFMSIAQAMTAVSRSEPGTLGYEWFASADGKRFRLVETYADANAIEAHFMGPAVQQWVPKIVPVSKVDGFEIYGDPGPLGGSNGGRVRRRPSSSTGLDSIAEH
jgi:quinol monooxygenase YgiN